MANIWRESLALAWRNFGSRNRWAKSLIRYLTITAVIFIALRYEPWFGVFNDEAKLQILGAVALVVAGVIEFLMEFIAAPNTLYRKAKEETANSQILVEYERGKRPEIEVKLIKKTQDKYIYYHLMVSNKGESAQFSAQIEIDNVNSQFGFGSNKRKALWINEKESPYIFHGDSRYIYVVEIHIDRGVQIFYRDTDGDPQDVSFQLRDDKPVSNLIIRFTISTNPRSKNGSISKKYSITAWYEVVNRNYSLQSRIVDLDEDKWGAGL